MDDLPDFRAYKERSIDTLNLCPNSRVADLACGLGFDLLRLHRRVHNGHVVGFDISHDLVVAARQYVSGHDNVEVVQSDALHLEAEDQYFDAVRIDRSLQHIKSPRNVVSEMVRVTKAGGFVSASEPDWASFHIACDYQDLMRIALNEWISSFKNPFIGVSIVDIMSEQRLEICHHFVETIFVRNWHEADVVFDIGETIRRCTEKGAIEKTKADSLMENMLDRHLSGRFFARLCIHTVTGRTK